MTPTEEKILEEARKARDFAYAPYSGFTVGAAVLAGSGRIYTGCNVENVSFPASMCAERVAIYEAVAAGEKEIELLAVVAEGERPVVPCGACRQVMAEFEIPRVLLSNTEGKTAVKTLDELLPDAFSGEDF